MIKNKLKRDISYKPTNKKSPGEVYEKISLEMPEYPTKIKYSLNKTKKEIYQNMKIKKEIYLSSLYKLIPKNFKKVKKTNRYLQY